MKPWYGSMFCRAPGNRGRAFTLLPIPLRSFFFYSIPPIPTSPAVLCPPIPPSTAGYCRRKDQTVTPQTDDSAPRSTSFIQRSPLRDLVGRLSIPKSTFQHTFSSRGNTCNKPAEWDTCVAGYAHRPGLARASLQLSRAVSKSSRTK